MKTLKRDQVIHSFNKEHSPQLEASPGAMMVVKTEDCFNHQITREEETLGKHFDYGKINPATGPIKVEGAQPGDTLVVDIKQIDLANHGVTVAYPGWGPLGEKVEENITGISQIEEDSVNLFGCSFPCRPMVGVIGVAPKEGDIPCGRPGQHGGNLDTLDVSKGSTVYLPVQVAGGLLALGDVHATMGEGEVCGTGVEARARVKIKVSLIKESTFAAPVIKNEEAIYFLSSAKTLSQAAKLAVKRVVDYITQSTSFSWEQSYMLASIATDLKISQIVNPLKTVRVRIPQNLLPTDFEPFN